MPYIGGPLIFNHSIVDALTNGPRSELICVGLLVPIKCFYIFKITDLRWATAIRIQGVPVS